MPYQNSGIGIRSFIGRTGGADRFKKVRENRPAQCGERQTDDQKKKIAAMPQRQQFKPGNCIEVPNFDGPEQEEMKNPKTKRTLKRRV